MRRKGQNVGRRLGCTLHLDHNGRAEFTPTVIDMSRGPENEVHYGTWTIALAKPSDDPASFLAGQEHGYTLRYGVATTQVPSGCWTIS